eukprot:207129-Prymnesium_polylepis.1
MARAWRARRACPVWCGQSARRAPPACARWWWWCVRRPSWSRRRWARCSAPGSHVTDSTACRHAHTGG